MKIDESLYITILSSGASLLKGFLIYE